MVRRSDCLYLGVTSGQLFGERVLRRDEHEIVGREAEQRQRPGRRPPIFPSDPART